MRIPLARWVAPFGDPGINDRSHLPRAFRSVPRPSSPLSAKASTRCPSFALERHTQRQEPQGPGTGNQNSGSNARRPAPASHAAGAANSPLRRHYGIPQTTRQADKPLGRPRFPASVTQLASSPFAINNAPELPQRNLRGQILCRCRVFGIMHTRHRGSPTSGFSDIGVLRHRGSPTPGALQHRGSRRGLGKPLSPSPAPAASSVVEVNGLEPSTSCLQSRRSPS
jgi:hypothetical protein